MTYHRPTSLRDALDARAKGGLRVLAGGTDIFPATDGRDLAGDILDLSAVTDLGGISATPDGWRIGASCVWREVIAADLPPAFGALKQAARQVGSVQIQNRATVAGNLCNASPAADGVPPLLVLDAMVELASSRQTRLLPLEDFITGPRRTALLPDEIMLAIHIPQSASRGIAAFSKLGARAYLVISIAMVAVKLELKGGLVRAARVAVGACSPVARRLTGFEAALVGCAPQTPSAWMADLRDDIAATLSPIDDIRASGGYRAGAVAELVARTIEQAAAT